jgi:hypothetical protein
VVIEVPDVKREAKMSRFIDQIIEGQGVVTFGEVWSEILFCTPYLDAMMKLGVVVFESPY